MLGNFKKLFQGSRSPPPRIITQPQSVYDAVPGSAITLFVMMDAKQSYSTSMQFEWQYCHNCRGSVHGSPPESWETLKSGEKDRVTGLNTSTLLISGLQQSDAGSYRCQITNTAGVTHSRPAILTIVVPPQIEAHPSDVVDVITGSEALFHVEVNCLQSLAANRVQQKRGGSLVWEGLQFSWEVLRSATSTAKFVSTAANGGTGDHHNATSQANDKSPETPQQRIFRKHHPDLRHYLNTSSILPYLSKHSLVTADQLEELTLPVLTNARKVDLLLNWLPRSTVDFLEKFIVCLREADDHLAHAELAGKLEEAMEGERLRSDSQASEPSPPLTPMVTSPVPPGVGTVEAGGWEVVREEEGKVEGTATVNLRLLHVEKYQEGKYRCRVVFKGCAAVSQPASLTVLEDDEIIRRLHQQCLNVEETIGDAAVAEFLEKYGNTSRLAKKALVSALQCETELPHLIQSFTRREVPVNFLQDGMSPLHWACVRGHWRMVQHLLSCGASKTTLTQEGRNAVHLVCERGDNNSLQFLIHTGAEELVNVQDKHGKTPLHLACEAAQKIVPSKLISHDMRDIKTVIQNLLSHNTSLRAADENGQTPLHMAAIAGHPWIVEVVLLCNTAGLNDQDHEQNTPLHYASSLNWSEVVISLLERGANETIEDKDHMTPLAVAEAKGHTDVANILKRKPGTVKRDRKHTVYVTEQRARPRSANIEIDPISSPMQSSRLLKSPSVEKSAPQRRSAHLPQPTSLDSPGRFFSSSALLKLFHHNSTEKKECTAQSQQEATLMSGYLQKMEGKKWSRLWGQLQHDSTLYLYKAQEDSCATSSLALVGFKVEPIPSSMTIHLLHPKGKSKHNCVFKLDNEPEFTQWVEMLEKTVGGDLLPPLQPDVLFSPPSPHSDLSPP